MTTTTTHAADQDTSSYTSGDIRPAPQTSQVTISLLNHHAKHKLIHPSCPGFACRRLRQEDLRWWTDRMVMVNWSWVTMNCGDESAGTAYTIDFGLLDFKSSLSFGYTSEYSSC